MATVGIWRRGQPLMVSRLRGSWKLAPAALVWSPLSRSTYARGFSSTSTLYERKNDDGFLDSRQAKSIANNALIGTASEIGFAFDIDGVLYQGHRPISGAREMLRKIKSHGIRYVFLTNGGGTSEDSKVKSLAKRLQFSEGEDAINNRVILSHTPMRGWDDVIKKQSTVLITGSHPETARKVAIQYGFEKAVTPADIIAANDKLYPFDNLRDSLHKEFRPLPDGKILTNAIDPYSKDIPEDLLKIDKILVWNDPRDWSLDIQLIHDLLVSHQGYLGTISDKNGDTSLPNNGWQQDGQPEVWISNLDLFWKTEFPVNRFGTGAFVDALKGVWSSVTGGAELQYKALGKPSQHTYEYAHDRLVHHEPSKPHGKGDRRPLRRVYMIGDNPESDIRGANEFAAEDGTEWVSILVRTGVWQQTATEREPRYRPAVIVDDVVDAIVWAMGNEGVMVTRDWLIGGTE